MADQANETLEIAASSTRILEVLLDFDAYPEWARDVKGVTVDERDEQGRGTQVTFRAAAMGRSTVYTLGYEHGEDPLRLAWRLLDGDIMRRLDGSYVLEPSRPGFTQVTYHLDVELVIPLPGFVKQRAELKIIQAALRELRARVTQG